MSLLDGLAVDGRIGVDREAMQTDIANLQTVMRERRPEEIFMAVASPGIMAQRGREEGFGS